MITKRAGEPGGSETVQLLPESGGIPSCQTPFYRWLHAQLTRLLHEAIEQRKVAALDVAFTADAIFAAIAPPLVLFQQQGRGCTSARIAAGMHRRFIDGLRATKPEQ
jgi:hypothetical protein